MISRLQLANWLPHISDHQIVAGNISIPKDDITRKEITFRKLKSISYTDLAEEMYLDSCLLENLENNDLVKKFDNSMKDALNIVAPEVTKTITGRHWNPWFTDELIAQKKIVRRRGKNYKKFGQYHQWQALKEEMAKCKRMIWNLWKEEISKKFLEVRGNTKQLYNLVSKLTSTQQLNPLPEEIPNDELADRFTDYFIGKITNIQDSLANYVTYMSNINNHSQLPCRV